MALLALALGALAVPACAGHDHGASGAPATFGTIDFENSCARTVQAEFRTAVAMLHSFAADARQFADVARHDPSCAIAWWGAAMAARGNPLVGEPDPDTLKAGRQYLARARNLKTTPRERGYLDAMEVYYRDYPGGGQLARTRAYEAAMQRLFGEYPDDAEIAAFYGLAAVEAVDLNVRNYDQQRKAGTILEALLARHPDHPGGLHYLIHAYDFAPLAERGLPAARRYAAAAPASYHARHMPAHIFTMLGLWEESIRANRESNAVIDPKHADDASGGDIASTHAFDFIVYARLQLAQDRWVAEDLLAAGKAGQAATLVKARYALERGDWQAATEVPLAQDGGFDDVTARFARALGSARLGRIEQASAELNGLRALRAGIAQSIGAYWAGFVDIYAGAVDGWIAKAEGHPEQGLQRMQQAADLDDGREKNIAMENKLLPMRELLGEFLLELGRPAAAETEFAKSLENAPNRYRSFLGAARAAVAAGDVPKARDYYGKLLKLTLTADSRSQEISEARNFREH
jgi:tetratricopeptide (TPR) repeat protein